MRGSLSGNLATMGPGVPYGIGAKFGHPGRPVIVFSGDGAMQMNGLAELITVKHYWEQWSDSRLIIAVLHNNDLNQVTWEMRAMEGAPKFTESQTLPDVSYEAFARSLGLNGIAVDKPEQVGPAWDQALAAGRPDGARLQDRPRRAADSAARHLRADEGRRHGAAEGRPEQVGGHQGRPDGQGQGSHPRQRQLTRRPNETKTLAVVFGKCLTFRWSSSVQVPATS